MTHTEQQSPKALSVVPDPEKDLVLEICKNPCELYSLGYVLVVDLSIFLFLKIDILPLISERKTLFEHMLTMCTVQKISFFTCL